MNYLWAELTFFHMIFEKIATFVSNNQSPMIRHLLFFAALCGLVACQDVPSDRIVIEGYIDQVPDSVVVRFFRSNGDYGEPIGADTLRDGRFSMTITPPFRRAGTLLCGLSGSSQLPDGYAPCVGLTG